MPSASKMSEMPDVMRQFVVDSHHLYNLACTMRQLGFRVSVDDVRRAGFDCKHLASEVSTLRYIDALVRRYGTSALARPDIRDGRVYDGRHRIAYALAMGHDLICDVTSSCTTRDTRSTGTSASTAAGCSDQHLHATTPTEPAAIADLATLSQTYSNDSESGNAKVVDVNDARKS